MNTNRDVMASETLSLAIIFDKESNFTHKLIAKNKSI